MAGVSGWTTMYEISLPVFRVLDRTANEHGDYVYEVVPVIEPSECPELSSISFNTTRYGSVNGLLTAYGYNNT